MHLKIEGFEILGDILEKELRNQSAKKSRSQTVSCLKERHPEVGLHTICRLFNFVFLLRTSAIRTSSITLGLSSFGYSRQAYYKSLRKNNRDIIDDARLLIHIERIRVNMPRIGTRKLKHILGQDGVVAPRDRLFSLLRENNMLVKKRKRCTITTNSRHWMRKYPNLKCGLKVPRPNMVWMSDITYIPIENSYCYLSLITDGCSRKIVGHCLCETLDATGPIEALRMALISNNENIAGLIHHSDRGIQYCCKEYVGILKSNLIRISMTEHGDPYENALAERVNGILKDEWLNEEKFSVLRAGKDSH